MDEDKEIMLVKKYPKIFIDWHGDKRQTCMAWGLAIGNGWYNIIDELCDKLTNLTKDTGIEVIATQVKEKFGGLRFYIHKVYNTNITRNDEVEDLIFDALNDAEDKSYHICEYCGKPGTRKYNRSWIKTLCEKCDIDIQHEEEEL